MTLFEYTVHTDLLYSTQLRGEGRERERHVGHVTCHVNTLAKQNQHAHHVQVILKCEHTDISHGKLPRCGHAVFQVKVECNE